MTPRETAAIIECHVEYIRMVSPRDLKPGKSEKPAPGSADPSLLRFRKIVPPRKK